MYTLYNSSRGFKLTLPSLDSGVKGSLSQPADGDGMPHTLVLTAAALRAANLARQTKIFQTNESKVIKLFAKHIKFQEAAELCQKTRYISCSPSK